jgi:parallel beta-helix repeat protein
VAGRRLLFPFLVLSLVAWTVILGGDPALASHVNCGAVLTEDIQLDSDLVNCPDDGLVIGADDITVDLNGHEITGSGSPGSVGIRNEGYDGVTIEDGQILAPIGLDFGFAIGILLSGVQDNRVRRLSVSGGSYGIALFDSAANRVRRNGAIGGAANECDTPTGVAIALFRSDRNLLLGNSGQLSDFGITLFSSQRNRIQDNEVAPLDSDGNQCVGIALFRSSDDNDIEGNVAANNDHDGILVNGRSDGTLVKANVATFNGLDDGIDVNNPDTTIVDNTANGNGDLGIEAVAGVTDGGGNRASGNGDPRQCVNVVCT